MIIPTWAKIAGAFLVVGGIYSAGWLGATEHYEVQSLRNKNAALTKQLKDTNEINEAASKEREKAQAAMRQLQGKIDAFKATPGRNDAMSADTARRLRNIAKDASRGYTKGRRGAS
ncbi:MULTISPECIES: hypothetical protein [unclassified Beijerinckia]|uniref:hypothetical protein n=1 Tax=unclassified Beijerinckia TaxID=2638183 RepID=UPI00089591AD|nr:MULTISPECIES: hypothetical protein [unclassified Beijerinckia]MDH7796445.1 FtsZ-binding cell division protein ZapB [Beijerinckia sp. GAS462]SEC45418.1 hypothetical protein SAMN05443249_2727 [Beijerinckia sp. 28-YEA-48]